MVVNNTSPRIPEDTQFLERSYNITHSNFFKIYSFTIAGLNGLCKDLYGTSLDFLHTHFEYDHTHHGYEKTFSLFVIFLNLTQVTGLKTRFILVHGLILKNLTKMGSYWKNFDIYLIFRILNGKKFTFTRTRHRNFLR